MPPTPTMMGWDVPTENARQTSPFGDFDETSADCFGRGLEDLDPFQNSKDSFGSDKEWIAFNGSSDGNHEDNKNSRSKSSSSKPKPMRSLKKDYHDSRERPKSSTHDRKAKSSSSPRRPRSSSSSSRTHSTHMAKGPQGFDENVFKAFPMENFKSAKAAGGADDDTIDPFQIGLGASSDSSPSCQSRKSQPGRNRNDFSNRDKGTIPDGFAESEGFGVTASSYPSPEQSRRRSPKPPASRRHVGRSSPRAPLSPNARSQRVYLDDDHDDHGAFLYDNDDAEEYEDGPFDRSTRSQRSTLSSSSSKKVVTNRDGSSRRLLPSEDRRRSHRSGSRRNAVKDAMEKFDDDTGEEGDVALSSFLNDRKGLSSHRRINDGESIQSAPAADLDHHRKRQAHSREYRARQRSHRHLPSTPHQRLNGSEHPPRSKSDGERSNCQLENEQNSPRRSKGTPISSRSSSRRSSRNLSHHNKRLPAASSSPSSLHSRRGGNSGGGADLPKSDRTKKLTVDLATLADQGYIEVVDGKMRLVVDVEDAFQ